MVIWKPPKEATAISQSWILDVPCVQLKPWGVVRQLRTQVRRVVFGMYNATRWCKLWRRRRLGWHVSQGPKSSVKNWWSGHDHWDVMGYQWKYTTSLIKCDLKWPFLNGRWPWTWPAPGLIRSKVRALHRRVAVYGQHGPGICMDPIAQARSKVGGDEDLRGKQNIVPLGMRF